MDNPTPLYISLPWIISSAILVFFYLYLRFKPDRVTKYGDAPWEIEARKAQEAAGAVTSTASKAEKKKEKAAAEVKQKVEEVAQKATAQQTNNQNHEEKTKSAAKGKKAEPTPVQTEVTEARKRWNKRKAGEEAESPEPVQEAPAKVQVPEEDEWHTVTSNRPPKRKGKSKRD